ncbi:MAG: Hsp20/alpha crystallin family protein [Limisphaerales bacterium]|jgi:HSP20 family protein|nr:Hsp20/alpha crystallin family protein [Verrucomicrobiota bacterium]MDG1833044.1 Hsp20/alpha crystallin family protein [Verrucomicrobiota bacterium]
MNTLSIWNPIHEMDELFHNRLASVLGGEGLQSAAWSPVVDIEESAEAYTIRAELPGLSKEKVKVTVENGALTLSGERDLERRVETKTFHRVERSHGTFTRSFTLPDDVDPESVAANFKDGLLEIQITKREEALPKSIEVRVE